MVQMGRNIVFEHIQTKFQHFYPEIDIILMQMCKILKKSKKSKSRLSFKDREKTISYSCSARKTAYNRLVTFKLYQKGTFSCTPSLQSQAGLNHDEYYKYK